MSAQAEMRAPAALDRAREAADTLAVEAAVVDRDAVFPVASVAALAEAGLLAAAAPARLDGLDLDPGGQAGVARALARGCCSTAMVWAMHQVQLACLAQHSGGEPPLEEMLSELIAGDGLIASVTSEAGVGGDLRSSRAACETSGNEVRLEKNATTVSYGTHAAAFLITARRRPDSAAGDQVLVLATAAQSRLQQQAAWDTMGMRGTCSPPFSIEARLPAAQILPVPFAEIAALTMVPLSHILWSAVWIGCAEEALARATAYLRKKGGPATNAGLVRASQRLQMLDGLLATTAERFSRVRADGVATREFGVLANNLKLAASTLTVEIAAEALEICGMAGYVESSPLSIARILRDLYSARLMVSNSRLVETNSTSLLLERYR
jgi:acyl-CoA dehydrogenase